MVNWVQSVDGLQVQGQETMERYIVEGEQNNFIVWGQFFQFEEQDLQRFLSPSSLAERRANMVRIINNGRMEGDSKLNNNNI